MRIVINWIIFRLIKTISNIIITIKNKAEAQPKK